MISRSGIKDHKEMHKTCNILYNRMYMSIPCVNVIVLLVDFPIHDTANILQYILHSSLTLKTLYVYGCAHWKK